MSSVSLDGIDSHGVNAGQAIELMNSAGRRTLLCGSARCIKYRMELQFSSCSYLAAAKVAVIKPCPPPNQSGTSRLNSECKDPASALYARILLPVSFPRHY